MGIGRVKGWEMEEQKGGRWKSKGVGNGKPKEWEIEEQNDGKWKIKRVGK